MELPHPATLSVLWAKATLQRGYLLGGDVLEPPQTFWFLVVSSQVLLAGMTTADGFEMLDGGGRPGRGVLFGLAGRQVCGRFRRSSELFNSGSSRSRLAPLPPFRVLAGGNHMAKFIVPRHCLIR